MFDDISILRMAMQHRLQATFRILRTPQTTAGVTG